MLIGWPQRTKFYKAANKADRHWHTAIRTDCKFIKKLRRNKDNLGTTVLFDIIKISNVETEWNF